DAAGTVTLVGQLFEDEPFGFAGAAFDGPLDVVFRHADLAGLVDGVTKFEVRLRVAAAVTGGDDDGAAQLAEHLAALGVDGAFLMLNRCPVGMAGHGSSFFPIPKKGREP